MSNLTETFSLKLSKSDKKFLDSLSNPSEFVRSLIRNHRDMHNGLSKICILSEKDGEKAIAFDESKFREFIRDTLDDFQNDQIMIHMDQLLKE